MPPLFSSFNQFIDLNHLVSHLIFTSLRVILAISYWIWVLVAAIFGYILLMIATYYLQDLFYFHPELLPQDFIFESKYEIPFKEEFIIAEDGSQINGLLYQIKDSKGVVCYFKGNTRSIKGWGKFAKDFVSKGYDLFMFDYPGFGKSIGNRSETKLYEYSLLAYDWLAHQYPEEQMIVYGRSFGSGFAAYVASQRKPHMLILDSPYYSFKRLASYYAFFLPLKWLAKYHMPVHHFLKQVDCPTYILHGNKDRLIPYKFGKMLRDKFPEKVELLTIHGGRHNNLPQFAEYHKFLYNLLNHEELYQQHPEN